MENPRLHLAEQFVLHTRKNIFLTGRAGTGKTTFLRNVLKKTKKKYIVVAPTGVAAINAGGVTIHSMFGFPLTAFTPDQQPTDLNLANNRSSLAKHLRYNRDKLKLLREIDLLVIDEISMVRADLLDAIDFALKRTRKKDQPFGNVQLLVLGDLFQLAPVVNQSVWHILRKYYESPYFFAARSWERSEPITIELTKIYRQNNQEFIDILNRIRYGDCSESDINCLNKNYKPDFKPGEKKYVTLTTHNHKANRINTGKLNELPGKSVTYSAEIVRQFNENAYPAEAELTIKEGAQVMFIRNDTEGRYFNGKLAEVIEADKDDLRVRFEDGETLYIEKVTWENKKYELDKETNDIQAKVLGSFIQYPLRLAWAVTVHKSQGLTFDRLIVDLGETFASGQAYVALSRCTNLDGLVLLSPLQPKNIIVNDQIVRYHDQAPKEEYLGKALEDAKIRFAGDQLKSLFDFDSIVFLTEEWVRQLEEKTIPEKKQALELIDRIQKNLNNWHRINRSFKSELHYLMIKYSKTKDSEQIQNRINKAVFYYTNAINNELILPVKKHADSLQYKTGIKKYLTFVKEFLDAAWLQIDRLYNATFFGEDIYKGEKKYRKDLSRDTTSKKKKRSRKGATLEDTLTLYRQGKSIDQIAGIRSLATGTIETHLARLIGQGDLLIDEVMNRERVEKISFYMLNHDDLTLTMLKSKIPFEVDYSDLRMVKEHLSRIK
ncbi:MAG: AAA family ATPase [Saprospiraceae bacterium]|nr:AAA family ATPase [Saprospiraceae bacterium]